MTARGPVSVANPFPTYRPGGPQRSDPFPIPQFPSLPPQDRGVRARRGKGARVRAWAGGGQARPEWTRRSVRRLFRPSAPKPRPSSGYRAADAALAISQAHAGHAQRLSRALRPRGAAGRGWWTPSGRGGAVDPLGAEVPAQPPPQRALASGGQRRGGAPGSQRG